MKLINKNYYVTWGGHHNGYNTVNNQNDKEDTEQS